ncbi:MAG: hypothetical protein JSW37_00050 [Anaerolineales bacterium]|nr:MAG: hypothetical protein JSW37_00050 [Anaerolineales bacterium]
MDAIVLDRLPFELDMKVLRQRLRIASVSPYLGDLRHLLDEARAVARPKALYRVAFVEAKQDDYVVIEGVRLCSRVLRVNLGDAHRVFAYVATCGMELGQWCSSQSDLLRQFWAETIAEMALRGAIEALRQHLADRYHPGSLSSMAPGSLADWPLEEQRALFTILGNTEKLVGVRLTDHMLMIPIKSLSGIFFPTQISFESCQLCSRARCPGRRAPYDQGLYERKYRPAETH